MKSALFLKTLGHLALASLAFAHPQAPVHLEVDIVIKAETDAPGAAVLFDMDNFKYANLQQHAMEGGLSPAEYPPKWITEQSEWDKAKAQPDRLVILEAWAKEEHFPSILDPAYEKICLEAQLGLFNIDFLRVDIGGNGGNIDVLNGIDKTPLFIMWKNQKEVKRVYVRTEKELRKAIGSAYRKN